MLLPPLKQKLIIAFLFFTLALLGSLLVFAPKANAANKPGPNSPSWANGYECASCGDGTWDNPGAFHISSTDAGLQATKTQNNIKFVFDVIATESKGLIVFKGSDGSYAIFENGEYSKPIFVRDLNSTAEGYKPSWTLRQDGLAQDNSQRPQAPGGKEYCSLKYDYSQKDCIDAPTGNKPNFSDEQWERVRVIVENGNAANDSSKDCGDDSTLSFITCPIFNMVNKTIGKLIGADGSGKGLLIDMFYIQPLSFKNVTNDKTGQDANPLYTAWDRMKNLALTVYVIIFLVVIFGNSMSLGIDAYTIKKTLPRLMAAAILTQFSFLIMSILIDFSNVIGITLPSFILAQGPQTFTLNLNGMSGFLGGIVAFLLMLILVIMALFSLIVALITIVARQLIVFLLVLTAPLAFAAWVLPNTQTLFKKWWSNLWRILAMFPIATGIIAAAIMFSRIAGHQAGSSNLAQLTGALAPLIALAILPKTFKWGGDFVNAATGAAVGFAAGRKDWVKGKGKNSFKDGMGARGLNKLAEAPGIGRIPGIGGVTNRQRAKKMALRRGAIGKRAGEGVSDFKDEEIAKMWRKGSQSPFNLQLEKEAKKRTAESVKEYGAAYRIQDEGGMKYHQERAVELSKVTGKTVDFASIERRIDSGYDTGGTETSAPATAPAAPHGTTASASTSAPGSTIPAPGSPTSPIVVAPAPRSSTSAGSSSDVVAELKRIGEKLDDIGSTPASAPPAPAPPSSPEPHSADVSIDVSHLPGASIPPPPRSSSSSADSSHLPGSDHPLPPWLKE